MQSHYFNNLSLVIAIVRLTSPRPSGDYFHCLKNYLEPLHACFPRSLRIHPSMWIWSYTLLRNRSGLGTNPPRLAVSSFTQAFNV